jgi:hypothetical protein
MERSAHMVMHLLSERIPVTLLLDLVSPPDARELYRREGASVPAVTG